MDIASSRIIMSGYKVAFAVAVVVIILLAVYAYRVYSDKNVRHIGDVARCNGELAASQLRLAECLRRNSGPDTGQPR